MKLQQIIATPFSDMIVVHPIIYLCFENTPSIKTGGFYALNANTCSIDSFTFSSITWGMVWDLQLIKYPRLPEMSIDYLLILLNNV
jgi:hypothetical protein